MTIKYLLVGGLALAVMIAILSTGGLSACNILENRIEEEATPTPMAPEALSPMQRISNLESRYSLIERENKSLKDKLESLQLRIIELEAR